MTPRSELGPIDHELEADLADAERLKPRQWEGFEHHGDDDSLVWHGLIIFVAPGEMVVEVRGTTTPEFQPGQRCHITWK